MSQVDHYTLLKGFSDVIGNHQWHELGTYVHDDVVWEYPQSGERFVGVENLRAQFANYPGLEPGSSSLEEVIGGPTFALTPLYTVVAVEGSGDRGVSIIRVRYPDASLWFAINVYELRDGRIARSRSFFAPDFEAPDWRAPYRVAP